MSKTAVLPPDPDHNPLVLRAIAWLTIALLLWLVGAIWHGTFGASIEGLILHSASFQAPGDI